MIVNLDKSFLKTTKKLKNQSLNKKVIKLIDELENCSSIKDINNCKKLTGYKSYYRIRIGDYRVGFEEISDKEITLIITSHRKDIYNKFP